jgi:hypothetical protein
MGMLRFTMNLFNGNLQGELALPAFLTEHERDS